MSAAESQQEETGRGDTDWALRQQGKGTQTNPRGVRHAHPALTVKDRKHKEQLGAGRMLLGPQACTLASSAASGVTSRVSLPDRKMASLVHQVSLQLVAFFLPFAVKTEDRAEFLRFLGLDSVVRSVTHA